MAKRKTPKVKDLIVKADKITTEELKELQDLVRFIDMVSLDVGRLEAAKHKKIHEIAISQDKLKLLQGKLEGKYGNVDIDIRDGSIKEQDGKADS